MHKKILNSKHSLNTAKNLYFQYPSQKKDIFSPSAENIKKTYLYYK